MLLGRIWEAGTERNALSQAALAWRGLLLPGAEQRAAAEPRAWSWHGRGEAGGLAAGQAVHLIQTQLELI